MTTALIITTLNEIAGVKKIVPKINKEWLEWKYNINIKKIFISL